MRASDFGGGFRDYVAFDLETTDLDATVCDIVELAAVRVRDGSLVAEFRTLLRGQRTAVCDKTYKILTQGPYADSIIPVPPWREVPLEKAQGFVCNRAAVRDPRETKGKRYRKTLAPTQSVCGPEGCC